MKQRRQKKRYVAQHIKKDKEGFFWTVMILPTPVGMLLTKQQKLNQDW